MALRARLTPPKQELNNWPWHQAKSASLSASLLFCGDRRMEAGNYLASGYGLRLGIESQKAGWTRMDKLAITWQPSRLKGILVGKEFGTPFLAATQIFELRPVIRKYLSLDRTDSAESRFVKSGMILITCSGCVGRSMLAQQSHENVLISHDLLRLEPRDPAYWGWIYAYLRSPQAISIMNASQYGHVIKHLEVSHINAIPIPLLQERKLQTFNDKAKAQLDKRNRAHQLFVKAEHIFEENIGPIFFQKNPTTGFTVSSTVLSSRRRRFEGGYHSPAARDILQRFKDLNLIVTPLSDLWEREWQVTRNKNVFGSSGIPYMSADELFQLNPSFSKRILTEQMKDADYYMGKAGWIAMACSGQVYGLNGSVMLLTKKHESIFLSQDLIRIIPRVDRIRPGYLCVALGHQKIGRPLVIRNAYGTSIPHIDPQDIGDFPVVRLDENIENEIADCMEGAVKLRSEADELEEEMVNDAESVVDRFIAGNMSDITIPGKL
jgi:restriction endonuclease S subunit